MKDSITRIYCVCDEFAKTMNIEDDVQCRWSSAQVMTAVIVAARHFGGNLDLSRRFLLEHGYIAQQLSKSRLNRRWHRLPEGVWLGLFAQLSAHFKARNAQRVYLVDSLPLPVCQKVRIARCRLFPFAKHRSLLGYVASKKSYFYGLRLHLLVTQSGEPVEFVLADGSRADLAMFKLLPLELTAGSFLYGDKAYNDYKEEDLIQEAAHVHLQPLRKAKLKRQWTPWHQAKLQSQRQRIETTFSQIVALLPRHLKVVTAQGFVLKVYAFLLAFSFQCLDKGAT